MEEHVGMIANNPNYKLEELEKLYGDINPNSGVNDSPPKGFGYSGDPNEDPRM